MSNLSIPHIRIPRSLLENPLWIDLPPAYRDVFTILLENVCFFSKKFDDHGCVIDLDVGQWCGTYRELAKLCGKYGDKNIVERSIKKFVLYGFVRQEVRHIKSVLTITHSDTYDLIKRASETRCETGLRQDQDRIETQKKKERIKEQEEQHARMRDAAKPLDENYFHDQRVINESGEKSAIETESDNIRLVTNSEALTENKNNYLSSKKKSIQPSTQALELLGQFESSLAIHVPEVSLPLKKSQAKNFDSLLKKHDREKINKTIHFAHQHHFWRQRIHAVSDLERNFSKVLAEFNSGKLSNHHPPASPDITRGKEFETEIDPFLMKITGERVYES